MVCSLPCEDELDGWGTRKVLTWSTDEKSPFHSTSVTGLLDPDRSQANNCGVREAPPICAPELNHLR